MIAAVLLIYLLDLASQAIPRCDIAAAAMPRRRRQQLHRSNLSQHVFDGRRVLCSAISELPSDSPCSHVSSILEPLLEGILQGYTHECSDGANVSEVDGVTPTMVACDKAQLGCLEFINRKINTESAPGRSQLMVDIMGHPLDRCSNECGGNSAAHLLAALKNNCADGLDLLVTILEKVVSENDDFAKIMENVEFRSDQKDRNERVQATQDRPNTRHQKLDLYLAIVATGNAHNDTPLMIASAGGHATFLSHVLRKIFPDGWEGNNFLSFSGAACESLPRVRRAFEMKNHSGDTALLLGLGHGHCSVVDVLINVVNVTYDDVVKSKTIVKKTDEALEMMRQKGHSNTEAYEKKGKNVRRCLVMLQVKQAQIAREHLENLLSEERKKDANNDNLLRRQKKTRSGKSTKKPAPCPSKHENNCHENAMQTSSDSDDVDGPDVPQQTIQSRSKPNDSSRVPSCLDSGEKQDRGKVDVLVSPSNSRNGPSDKILPTLPTAGNSGKEELATTLESEMESLCLDTSMLLLTSHGMAMQLSPSQLDVIENVLENQLAAVQEARGIQSRLLSQKK